jgi:predicted CoA-binding protein
MYFGDQKASRPLVNEVNAIGARALRRHIGIENDNAAAHASPAGLTVVMNACIGATHSLLRIPRKQTTFRARLVPARAA